MNPLGLDTQGMVPGAQSVGEEARGIMHGTQGIGPSLSGASRIKAAAGDVNSTLLPKPQTSEDRRIQRLQKIGGISGKLYGLDFANFAGASILGGLFAKMPRMRAGIRTLLSAPIETLRKTKVKDWHQLPANFMKEVEYHSHEAGGKAAANWTKRAKGTAEKLEKSGHELNDFLIKKAVPVTDPLKTRINQTLNAADGTKTGKKVESWLQTFTNKRASKAVEKYKNSVAEATQALSASEKPGMFAKAKNFVTRSKPALPEFENSLPEVAQHLERAAASTGQEAITHSKAANEALEKAFFSTEDKVLKAHIGSMGEKIEQVVQAAEKSHLLQNTKSETLPGMAKWVARMPGRMSVFGALMAVGITATVGAVLLTTRKESKEAKVAYKELSEDIGNDNHPLLQNIKKAYSKQKAGHLAGAGLEIVGEVANGALVALPTAGALKIGMAAMVLPQLKQLIVHDNPALNAYANLKREEQGVALKPEEKIGCLKMIMGTCVPDIVAAGGIYNRALTPLAEEIAAMKMNTRDTMQFIANGPKFNALATQVIAKQKEALAPVLPTADASVETAAHHEKPKDSVSKVDTAYHASPKPAMTVAAGDRVAQGVIASQQHAAGMVHASA